MVYKKNKQIDLPKEELPHYAKMTQDLYFNYHFGWGELCSNSHRGNYDLSQHGQHSQKDLRANGIIPEVIEVSFGVERLMLAILQDAYREEKVAGSELTRTVLKLPPLLAPFFVAIIPLSQQLRSTAHQLYVDLLPVVNFSLTYEAAPNIGKAYRRQDAIGTVYCLTVDFDTTNPQSSHYNTLTLRHRDNYLQQERIAISNLKKYLNNLYEEYWSNFGQK